MPIFDRLLTRRYTERRFAALQPRVRSRLALAARHLAEQEEDISASLGLSVPPRLLLIDEEEAVIVRPADRDVPQ
ncbi:hypothetical protein [Mangrovicella endophytica]|uniref:hypothetical protein n=1 Tax=Mangrovicella endophytica TaxID=2066697 RepID=UPI000C9EB9CD|nr:hypothetical protein [Mangrovicella endophytica]